MSEPQVLYVDDEPDILELVALHFADQAVRILTASSAQEALILCQQHRFKVIISDARMPGMKGTELYAELRAKGDLWGHFILVSGHYEAHELTTIPSGIQHVLSKPLDFEELWSAVKPLLS